MKTRSWRRREGLYKKMTTSHESVPFFVDTSFFLGVCVCTKWGFLLVNGNNNSHFIFEPSILKGLCLSLQAYLHGSTKYLQFQFFAKIK